MKTPDESKCGMECIRTNVERLCIKPEKGQCPRCKQLVDEFLAYIQQLESRLAQVERERDAAIVDMRSMAVEDICNLCARIDEGYIPMPPHCKYANDGDCFRWRGVCPENTKEKEK